MKYALLLWLFCFSLTSGCALFHGSHHQVTKDVLFKTVGTTQLKGDLYRPDLPGLKPAVLVVHGGGWDHRSGDMESLCHELAEAGFVAFNITYRLAPKSLYPDAVDDVRDALLWLQANAAKYEVNPKLISGWGYSAGAHLVLLVGLDPALGMKALIAGGTPADLTVWPDSPLVNGFLGRTFQSDPELWRQASPVNHVKKTSPPVFLYHGEWDHLVEPEQMQKMKQALQAQTVPVETYMAPYLGHIAVYFLSHESVLRGIEFLKRHDLDQ